MQNHPPTFWSDDFLDCRHPVLGRSRWCSLDRSHIRHIDSQSSAIDRNPFGFILSITTLTWVLWRGDDFTRDVFSAIADPTRRQILDLLATVDESPLYQMTATYPMSRTGVSKHLRILKEAGLVEDRKVGRESRYHLNASRLRDVQAWVSFYEKFWSEQMVRLKDLLEEDSGE